MIKQSYAIMSRFTRLLLLFATLATFVLYMNEVPANCRQFDMESCNYLHGLIISGTAPSPYSYRILGPILVNLFTPNASDAILTAAYAVLAFVCIAVAYPALWAWLRRWMNTDRAALGIVMTVVLCGMAFHVWFFSPYNIVEFALVCLALAAVEGFFLFYVLLCILAALNRETGLLLILVFAAFHGLSWVNKGRLAQAALIGGVWLGITVLLHLLIPTSGVFITIQRQLEINLHAIPQTVFFNLPFIPLVVLTTGGYHDAPPILRRMAWIIGVYGLLLVVASGWQEAPRLLLSVVPLALPIMLYKGD